MKEFEAVSLFCGAGGLDMGFDRIGFRTVWANDFDRDSCKTYQKCYSSCHANLHILKNWLNALSFAVPPREERFWTHFLAPELLGSCAITYKENV